MKGVSKRMGSCNHWTVPFLILLSQVKFGIKLNKLQLSHTASVYRYGNNNNDNETSNNDN